MSVKNYEYNIIINNIDLTGFNNYFCIIKMAG